nr:hypothetical protein JVH1_4326 [Rhodococcus sp. JVH1]
MNSRSRCTALAVFTNSAEKGGWHPAPLTLKITIIRRRVGAISRHVTQREPVRRSTNQGTVTL